MKKIVIVMIMSVSTFLVANNASANVNIGQPVNRLPIGKIDKENFKDIAGDLLQILKKDMKIDNKGTDFICEANFLEGYAQLTAIYNYLNSVLCDPLIEFSGYFVCLLQLQNAYYDQTSALFEAYFTCEALCPSCA
jgi:hypothetical protein